MLVFIDLVSGSLVFEEVAEDRSYDTWHALVKARIEVLGVDVLSLVSDRAKALIKLAETGLECLSMPEVFHLHPCAGEKLCACHWQSSATCAAGFAASGGAAQRGGGSAGAGRGGGACRRSDALGNRAPCLSAPPGERVVDCPSVARL